MSPVTNVPASLSSASSLTYKQTVELIRRLNKGTAGFDYSKYRLADLRTIIATWCAQGYFAPEYVESVADEIAAEAKAAPTVAPTVPVPSHIIAASVQAQQQPPVPSPFSATPFAAPTLVPIVAAPTVAPPAAPDPVPLPVAAYSGAQQRVHASQVFPEFKNKFPADLYCTLYASSDAPTVDPTYIFRYGHVLQSLAALACAPTMRTWLAGPRGTGKTEYARQIAARLQRPLFRVNFNRATEASEVIGDQGLRDGATRWVDGPVAAACRTVGALLLLDEITYASPGNLSSLNPILEMNGAHLRLPRTSETLVPAEGFAVMAADNTSGFGDASGEYAARNVIGSDTRDRFSILLQFDYLPAAAESKLLRGIVQRLTGKRMLKPVSDAIVQVMNVARAKAANGEIMGAPSLRGASAFATLIAFDVPIIDAYTSAVVSNAPPESAEELRQIFVAHWPSDLIQSADKPTPQYFAA